MTIESPIISVDVPIEARYQIDCQGVWTLINEQKIVNNSTVDVHIKEIYLNWSTSGSQYFNDCNCITTSVILGTPGTVYTMTCNSGINPSATDGLIGKNGESITLPWSIDFGTGNYIKQPCKSSLYYSLGTYSYLIE